MRKRNYWNAITLAALGTCAAIAIAALPGCNILGPAFLLVHGPEKAPAAYKLDKERSTVVFVDDRSSVLAKRALRQQIATAAQNELLKQGVLVNVIDASS